MGTAPTVEQVKFLLPHIDLVDGRNQIAVATDPDPAGWRAAQTAFWTLTAADLGPTHLALPEGLDPASLFETHGHDGIQTAVADRRPLAETMLDHLLRTAGPWSDPDIRQRIIPDAARILAAQGPKAWPEAFERLKDRLHLAPGILEHQTTVETSRRSRGRFAYTQARNAELNDRVHTASAPSASPVRHPQEPQRAAIAAGHDRSDTMSEADLSGGDRDPQHVDTSSAHMKAHLHR